MVRGNWQKRVEKAENRRQDAQLRKLIQENKKLWNRQVKSFLSQLDGLDKATRTRILENQVHVWTDLLPTSNEGQPLLDVLDVESGKKRGKKGRSLSIDELKGRNRSGSLSGSSPRKKQHPRSREALQSPDEHLAPPRVLLCRDGFYDSCSRKGCKYVHYHPPYETLSNVVTDKEMLANAKLAATESISELQEANEPGAMDTMLYHKSFLVRDLLLSKDGTPLGEAITKAVNSLQVGLHAFVYISVDDKLLYDRFCGGSLFEDDSVLVSKMLGDPSAGRRRQTSVGSAGEGEASILYQLNAPVLEKILEYLPDVAIGAVSRVCRAWHRETGTNSPNLWKHLLQRRQWPMPHYDKYNCSKESYRTEFIRHYSALRRLRALQSAISSIHKRETVTESEMCYQDFSRRKNVPTRPNTCISVHIWAKNQVLVAYGHDCSLRLFEATALPDSSEKRCRELIYQCVDPYRTTKKRTCRLKSVALDQTMIACHAEVAGAASDETAPITIVIQRDEFLLGESSATLDLNGSTRAIKMDIIDMGECVLNYCLCCDDMDHSLLQLTDYLQDGGDLGSIDVAVLGNIASCGFGRFLVEVGISIPVAVETGEEDSAATIWVPQLLGRKLLVFSASVGAVMWMGDSWPMQQLLPSVDEGRIQCVKAPRTPSSKGHFLFGLSMYDMPPLVGDIDPSGAVSGCRSLGDTDDLRRFLEDGGEWRLKPDRKCLSTMFSKGAFVTADAIEHLLEEEQTMDSVALTFYSADPWKPSSKTVLLDGNLEAVRLFMITETHALLLCRKRHLHAVDHVGEVDGHWFGEEDEPQTPERVSLQAFVFDTVSCAEIGRASVLGSISVADDADFPLITGADTIGIAHGYRGVAVTGSDVWNLEKDELLIDLADPAANRVQAKKKKQKRGRPGQKKGSKKDGFARGMSLRG